MVNPLPYGRTATAKVKNAGRLPALRGGKNRRWRFPKVFRLEICGGEAEAKGGATLLARRFELASAKAHYRMAAVFRSA